MRDRAKSHATRSPLRPEEYIAPENRQLQASVPSWFIPPPYGWRHPVTGRFGWLPDPLLFAFGQYVKRARYFARKTQRQLAREADVDQGQISRLERALAPSMGIERVVRLTGSLGRMFPLGYCPHEHACPWQPAPPPPDDTIDRLSPAMRAIAKEIGERHGRELELAAMRREEAASDAASADEPDV